MKTVTFTTSAKRHLAAASTASGFWKARRTCASRPGSGELLFPPNRHVSQRPLRVFIDWVTALMRP